MTEEQLKQWALKTNLDDALDLIDAYKKRVEELEKQILVWHNLRIDENDLPSKMGLGSKEVYVQLDDGVTDFAYYRFDKCSWERSEDEMSLGYSVIAWCEIPTFKE